MEKIAKYIIAYELNYYDIVKDADSRLSKEFDGLMTKFHNQLVQELNRDKNVDVISSQKPKQNHVTHSGQLILKVNDKTIKIDYYHMNNKAIIELHEGKKSLSSVHLPQEKQTVKYFKAEILKRLK